MYNENVEILVPLSQKELRYLISCGVALAQNVAKDALPTYCGFTVDEIVSFSKKIRELAERSGIDI